MSLYEDISELFATAIDGQDNEAIVKTAYEDLLGYTDADTMNNAQARIDYWVGKLASGDLTADTFGGAFLEEAETNQGDLISATTFANNKTVVEAHQTAYDEDPDTTLEQFTTIASDNRVGDEESEEDSGTPGETFTLTTNVDNLTGTDEDNTFTAEVQQNGEGASTNALSTGDVIDGGEGTDKLEATLVNDNQTQNGEGLTVNPRTDNLEQVYITGMDEDVTLDAGRMDSVEQFWSDDSDENVIVEDVRLGSDLNITKDVTFGMRDVDTDSGLSAAFESQSFKKAGATTQNSQIIVEVGDSNKDADTTTPVERIELELNFTFGGEAYSFESITSEDGTYQGLATAIESALSAEGLDGVEVALGDSFNTITAANEDVSLAYDSAQQVVITDPEGGEFTEFTSGVGATAGEASSNPVSDVKVVDPTESSTVIETNLVLDNAGRGSTAGDAIIGGMSDSDKTIEKLNLVVDRDSKIDDLATASGMEDNAFNSAGYEGFSEIELTSGDAEGDLSVEDIQGTTTFDASAFAGESLTINAASALEKLDANVAADVDVTASTAAGENVYTTGAGSDTLTITADGDDVDTVGESFAASTNGGDDTVVLNGENTDDGVSFATMDKLENLSVSTGAGDDVVDLNNPGTLDISTGDGSDFVRINSLDGDENNVTGLADGGNGNATAGEWTIGDPSQNVDNFFDERVLYEASLTVNFAGIEETVAVETDQAGNFIATQTDINTAVKAAIDGNHELSDLLNYEDGTGDQSLTITSNVGGVNNLGIAIYQPELVEEASTGEAAGQDVALAEGDVAAIRGGLISTEEFNSADSDDTTVANIVDATSDDNFHGSLNASGAGDEVLQSTADIEGDVTEGVNTADTAGGIFQDATNTYFDLQAGGSSNSDDGSINLSSVNVGDGSNDIVSVHSGNASANTLVVDEAFGKVTVVNWHKVSPDDVDNRDEMGEHALDFSAYLDDQIDDSDNDNADTAVEVAASANMVAGASALGTAVSAGLDNDNTARANSVNSIRFEQNLADDETFEALDGATLLTALNASDAEDEYGNLNDALLNPGTTANLVGDTQNHIVMVENDLNEGEYKVFHLTSESDADDFSTADELGTLDFGASINFNVAGSTTFKNYVEAASQAKDEGATDFTYDVVDSGGNVVATADADVNDGTGDAGGAGGGGAGAGGAGGGAGGGGAGGASETVEVTGAGNDDAANADVTFDFDDGAYEFDIANFDTGDTLDFGDVEGADQAIFNVAADANLGDGEKQLSAANGDTGDTVEVTLTGLTAAQDNAVFNQSSFENTFGDDSLVL